MKNYFLLVALFIANISMAQSLKTYSGAYPDGNSNNKGKATYTYREGEFGERIYEGKFTFSIRLFGTNTAVGQFVNNEKDGRWIYRNVSQISQQNLVVNYKHGIYDGQYRYEEKNAKGVVESFLYVTFSNGRLVGDFKYKSGNDTYITGKFDDQSRKQGKWEFLDIGETKYTFFFNNDVCNKGVQQNVQTGDIRDADFGTIRYYLETHNWRARNLEGMVKRGDHLIWSHSLDFNEQSSLPHKNEFDDIQTAQPSKTNEDRIYEDKIFDMVEEMPSYPGGQGELMAYLGKNIKYPVAAEENGVQGRVICTFVVERNGSITDVKVVKPVDPSLDKEAVRVIKSMPKWIPGKQNGSTVRVKFTLPVIFRLQQKSKKMLSILKTR